MTLFSGKDGTVLASFFDPRFRVSTNGGVSTGVRVAFSTSAGQAEILVTSGSGAPPLVDVFNAQTLGLLDEFFAFDPTFYSGTFAGG